MCMYTCIYIFYVNLYCDACCAWPPGKQPLAEGGFPVEIKVNNNDRQLKEQYLQLQYANPSKWKL